MDKALEEKKDQWNRWLFENLDYVVGNNHLEEIIAVDGPKTGSFSYDKELRDDVVTSLRNAGIHAINPLSYWEKFLKGNPSFKSSGLYGEYWQDGYDLYLVIHVGGVATFTLVDGNGKVYSIDEDQAKGYQINFLLSGKENSLKDFHYFLDDAKKGIYPGGVHKLPNSERDKEMLNKLRKEKKL